MCGVDALLRPGTRARGIRARGARDLRRQRVALRHALGSEPVRSSMPPACTRTCAVSVPASCRMCDARTPATAPPPARGRARGRAPKAQPTATPTSASQVGGPSSRSRAAAASGASPWATRVEKRFGSGWMKTRGRWSRSASQHAPIVASVETWPSEWSLSASARRSKRDVVELERALVAQLAREGLGAGAVPGVEGLVLAPRVVQEAEAEDEPAVGAGRRLVEREPRRGDAAPVGLAVPGRVPAPRAREHRLHEASSAPALPCLDHRTLRRGLR